MPQTKGVTRLIQLKTEAFGSFPPGVLADNSAVMDAASAEAQVNALAAPAVA